MVAASETQPPQAQSGKSPNSKDTSPSKVVEQSMEEQKQEAFSTLAAGKRHLLVSDIPLAVSTLGEACEMLSKVFGETAPECAEVYFYYGKALLEMARLESGVLGNALDGVPDGEDSENSQVEDPEKVTDEEKVDIEEKVEEALEENFEKHDKIAKIHNGVTNGDGEEEKEDEESPDEEVEGAEKPGEGDKPAEESSATEAEKPAEESPEAAKESEKSKDSNGEECKDSEEKKPKEAESVASEEKTEAMETDKADGESDVEGGDKEGEDQSAQEAEDEEDPSNLQLAWEMLELAKVVYTKSAETSKDVEVGRRLCETYMVLGEVSLENENYPQAVEDLSICLKRRTESLPADSRCIAETHYQLGIAQGFDMKWEEAIVSLEAAIKVLETRIGNLKAETESPDDSKKDDAFYTRDKEVAELEALLPEIKEKITDTNEMKAENMRKINEMKEAVGFSSGSGPSTASTSEAKPITSIAIKRKAEDKESEAKKPKEDAKEDGDSATA